MRHVISILLQNESGALARVAAMFANRGFNIESLSVAPTEDESVSRLTLLTSGDDTVISQINKQMGKLIDVVAISDRTDSPHFQRELGLLKFQADADGVPLLTPWVREFGARVLDPDPEHFTVELADTHERIDEFLDSMPHGVHLLSVVRSGPLVISRGSHALSAYTGAGR